MVAEQMTLRPGLTPLQTLPTPLQAHPPHRCRFLTSADQILLERSGDPGSGSKPDFPTGGADGNSSHTRVGRSIQSCDWVQPSGSLRNHLRGESWSALRTRLD